MADDWIAALDPERQGRARDLVRRFAELGASDPEDRARAEIVDDEPELARFAILRHLWAEAIDPCRDDLDWIGNLVHDAARDPSGPFADAGQALKRLLDAGADPADIGRLARFLAYETAFSVIHTLDEGYDPEREDVPPGWAVVERDDLGHLTGRPINGLHAALIELDPSGREGRPA